MVIHLIADIRYVSLRPHWNVYLLIMQFKPHPSTLARTLWKCLLPIALPCERSKRESGEKWRSVADLSVHSSYYSVSNVMKKVESCFLFCILYIYCFKSNPPWDYIRKIVCQLHKTLLLWTLSLFLAGTGYFEMKLVKIFKFSSWSSGVV